MIVVGGQESIDRYQSIAARARLNDNGFSPLGLQFLTNQARSYVCRRARPKGQDEADGAFRISLLRLCI
jgi:hypothetical protein